MNAGIFGISDTHRIGMTYPLLGRPSPIPTPDQSDWINRRSPPNTVAWWDCSVRESLVFNGNLVSQWRDLTGNGYHLAQTTAARQPTYIPNAVRFLPAIRWPSSGATFTRLTNAALVVSLPTIFAAFRLGTRVSTAQGPVLIDRLEVSSRFVMYPIEGTDTQFVFSRDAGSASQRATFTRAAGVSNASYVMSVEARSGSGSIWMNGVQGANATAGTNGLNGISVGDLRGTPNPAASNYGFYDDIYEIIVCDGPVAASQRIAVENYLMTKWGIMP